MQPTVQSLLSSPDTTVNRVLERFTKYQRIGSLNSTHSLDDVFSHFVYKPIQLDHYMNEDSIGAIQRMSTMDSEVDSSQGEITGSILPSNKKKCSENSLSSQQVQSPRCHKQSIKTEKTKRKPKYIQEFSRLNSVIPNYQHPKFIVKSELKGLSKLIKSALQAIHTVYDNCLRIGNKPSQIFVFPNQPHNLTLNFFLESGWEKKLQHDNSMTDLKPPINFKPSLSFKKIVSQLDMLLSKTSRYELAVSLTQEIDLDLYIKIRENMLQIEERLLQCSNSLYSLWSTNEYPDFYYMYLKILRNPSSLSEEETSIIIRQFRQLWDLHEPVTSSQIGQQVWSILHTRHSTIFK